MDEICNKLLTEIKQKHEEELKQRDDKIEELESKTQELESELESEKDGKEEVENERDSYYREKEELEEQIREMTWKLENDIYDDNFNECKYANGVYGNCDLDCPEWEGNIVDTVVKINEDQKEKIKELYEENRKLKSVLSRINPHFECDSEGDFDWDTVISDGGCIYEYVKLIKLQNKLQNNGLFNIKKETDKINSIDFTGSKINDIFISEWDNPATTYDGKNTFNGILNHNELSDYNLNSNQSIKKICEYYKTSDQEIGISITLSTGGCVYLTTWNLNIRE